MLFLQLTPSCDIEQALGPLGSLFLASKRLPLGQRTSKTPSSSSIQSDVGRQEFCKLDINRYMLIFVIIMSINSICWMMIRARNAVFTGSDHSCGSRS